MPIIKKNGHLTQIPDPKYIVKAKNKMDEADKAIEKEIKKEGLHIKHEWQIAEMLTAHTNKIPHISKDLQDRLDYPDWRRKELKDRFSKKISGQELLDRIEEKLQSEITYYTTKKNRLQNTSGLLSEELRLRVEEKVDRAPIGTTYYVDFTNGNDSNDGLGTGSGNAWLTLDKFCENTRSAGDICIVRGGMTQTATSNLDHTSDGTLVNPIIVKRDYGDEWSDHVDISGTATGIFTFGSKTVTFSADVSSVIAAKDHIYISGEDNVNYSYEVKTVATTTVTLWLPYKGADAGSGKTVINIGSNPQWNIPSALYEVVFNTDYYWNHIGIHFCGSNSNEVVSIDSSVCHDFINCIFESDGTTQEAGIGVIDDGASIMVKKCRFYNVEDGIESGGDGVLHLFAEDCVFDTCGIGISASYGLYATLNDIDFSTLTGNDIWAGYPNLPQFSKNSVVARNCKWGLNGPYDYRNGSAAYGLGEIESGVKSEDDDGTKGKSKLYLPLANTSTDIIHQSETTKVRAGGSNKSIKITPTIHFGTNWDRSKLKLFEIPIYATTASKTYTVYFASDSITEWVTNPTASELWVEFEAWGHTTNNHRKITKSTGTVDFTTDTDFNQSLSVTVAPAQAGVGYLRVYYAKTKEAADTNIFYVDPLPVIS